MSIQKYKIFLRHISASLVLLITILFFVGGSIYMFSKVSKSTGDITKLHSNIDDLNKKANGVLVGVDLNKSDVDQYTRMLSQLIPENEDFFSILTTIENLSLQTGYSVVKYSITPSTTSDQKLSLQIQGIGNADAFLNFIRSYPFSGGRFITSDSVTFNSKETSTSTLNLTFYSQKTSSLSEINKKLSPKDIQVLKAIKGKTVIITPQSEASGSGAYTTKTNPF